MMDDLTKVPVPELIAMAQGGGHPPAEQELMRRLADDPDNSAVAAALKNLGIEPDGTRADAQEPGGGASGGSTQGDQTWVVQRLAGGTEPLWIDVATVTVPPRTKRKTIVQKALEIAPDQAPPTDADAEPVPFRVLDADSAEEIPVGWDVPPAPEPQLRVG